MQKKTTTYDIGNPGPGFARTQQSGWINRSTEYQHPLLIPVH